jgi:hypothetical protein
MNLLASVCAATVVAAGAATLPARAQPIAAYIVQGQAIPVQVVEVSDLIRDDDAPYRGAYVGPPESMPMEDDDVVLAPEEIPRILRQQGFSQLGPVFRRGWVYTVAVLNEDGDDGRLIVDARSGEPIRFIPAMHMDTRLRDELDRMYDRPPPPPARFARDPYRDRPPRRDDPPYMADHDALPSPRRHVAPLKRAAKSIAKTAPKPGPATVAVAPAAPAKTEARLETKPQPDAAGVELQPTGPMPPVQPMD